MPKILFVINAAIVGGAERHTAALANDLSPLGFNSTIFALKTGSEGCTGTYELLEPAQSSGFIKRAIELADLINKEAFDVVAAVNQRPLALVAAATPWLKGRPRVAVIFHTTDLRNTKEEVMQIGYNMLFNKCDRVLFISENQRRHWLGRGMRPRETVTILNGIDTAFYAPQPPDVRAQVRSGLGIAEQDYILGCSAMLRVEKNHLQLVDAVAALRAARIPARCLLVGDGPMLPAIQAAAQKLGIEDHILTVGKQNDIRRFISAFDVGVLCSTAVETLSLSALEIMSMAIPMVMSEIGGASEIVDNTNGKLFTVGDTAALVAALRLFADAPHRALAGSAARAKVEREFDSSRMVARFADTFEDMAAARRLDRSKEILSQ